MTDDELEDIRRFVESDERDSGRAYAGCEALLAEVDRLRAKPKHAEEGWLANIRRRAAYFRDSVEATMRGDTVARLLDHIDATDGLLNDMQTDAGAMLAYEQGMAEERARITEALLSLWEWWKPHDMPGGHNEFIREQTMRGVMGKVGGTEMPEPMPPAAARLECDRLRAELERIASRDVAMRPLEAAHDMRDIARAALEGER